MCAIPSVILIFQMYMNQVIPDSICPFETPDYKTLVIVNISHG